MNKPPLTLNDIRKSEKIAPKNVGVAQFLSKEDLRELKRNNATRKRRKKRAFDDVDALIAEIIARFGYDTYKAWDNDEIDDAKMNRWLLAERARDRAQFIPLEGVIAHMVGACIRRHKKERAPKGPKEAQKIIAQEIKAAKGEE